MMKNNLKELYMLPTVKRANCKYFDYAATTFMPESVMNRWRDINELCGVSIGRGKSKLTKVADDILEKSENIFYDFFGISHDYSFIYFKNVTEAINIISMALNHKLKPLDMIVIGPYEHHSNYLPWKRLAKNTGALLVEIPTDYKGEIDYSFIDRYSSQIKLLSISTISNSFGHKVDINRISSKLSNQTIFLVDESQVSGHENIPCNKRINIHFISSHKMYGPKSIASAVVHNDLLEDIPPILLGGGMVENVGYLDSWASGRTKFLAGTIDVAVIAAWAEACIFLSKISYPRIIEHEKKAKSIIRSVLLKCNYKIIETDSCSDSIISFTHKSIHSHDINELLSDKNIVIRSGNLCSQNSIRKMELGAINRISFGLSVSSDSLYHLSNALEEMANDKILL